MQIENIFDFYELDNNCINEFDRLKLFSKPLYWFVCIIYIYIMHLFMHLDRYSMLERYLTT